METIWNYCEACGRPEQHIQADHGDGLGWECTSCGEFDPIWSEEDFEEAERLEYAEFEVLESKPLRGNDEKEEKGSH